MRSTLKPQEQARKKAPPPPSGGVEDEDIDADDALPKGCFIDEGEELPEPIWLVDEMIPEEGNGRVSGQSQIGKTTWIIHLATCVASGLPFLGREIEEPAGVIYLAREGVGMIKQRMRAAKLYLGLKKPIPLIGVTAEIDSLHEEDQRRKFIKLIKQGTRLLAKRFNVKTKLVIIDTIIQAWSVGSDNDVAEQAAIAKEMLAIGKETKTFVLGTDHVGKDASLGTRGSSAKKDNMQIELQAIGDRDDEKGTFNNRRLIQSKNRDGPEGYVAHFNLKFFELGRRKKNGKPYGAMVIEEVEITTVSQKPETHKWTLAENVFRDAFNESCGQSGEDIYLGDGVYMRAVERERLREVFHRLYVPAAKAAANVETPKRGRKASANPNEEAIRKAFERAIEENNWLRRIYPRKNDGDLAWFWSAQAEADLRRARADARGEN
jgi:hypothetical protein